MTGERKMPVRTVAERLQAQAELESMAAAEVRRIVDDCIKASGVTQTDIARSVGLDPARLSKALYPSNLTLRTLSLIALACDREWMLEALSIDEIEARQPSNYPFQPMIGPNDSYEIPIADSAGDRTFPIPFRPESAPEGNTSSKFGEFRQ